MTKSADYIPVKVSFLAENYVKLYIKEIVKLHGVPSSIIRIRVKHSTTFHPQTLKDILRACVIDFQGNNWDDHLPLIEFAYNNSYYSSITMAPFEALYGRRCRYLVGCFEVGEFPLIRPELVSEAIQKV
ncbi:hypothetical protein MTR67_044103 [Solanum verrucosum]|uniref:Uncharacterized protein n=1 Tax=Solanum verrucosum TaxID=315347 RepID=A0AAF0ZUZ2_SOLVR|nr:hypothetical protein MTR67_044103 [Solanum verrucosum]